MAVGRKNEDDRAPQVTKQAKQHYLMLSKVQSNTGLKKLAPMHSQQKIGDDHPMKLSF